MIFSGYTILKNMTTNFSTERENAYMNDAHEFSAEPVI